MSVAQEIFARHFSAATVRGLARNGIAALGLQAIPDERGSFLNSQTAYVVSDNGMGRVLTYQQVVDAAC